MAAAGPRLSDQWMPDGRNTQRSIAFYFCLVLLGAQFLANAVWRVPFSYPFLAITAAVVTGILFGPAWPIEFFRALRGSFGRNDDGGGDA